MFGARVLESVEEKWACHPVFANEFRAVVDDFDKEFKRYGTDSDVKVALSAEPALKKMRLSTTSAKLQTTPVKELLGETVLTEAKVTTIKVVKEPLVLQSRTGSNVYVARENMNSHECCQQISRASCKFSNRSKRVH